MGGTLSSNKVPKDLKNASVNVALERTSYSAGEVLNGYVDINIVNGHVSCERIDIEIKDEVHTTVHYTRTHGTGKNRRTSHHTARESAHTYCLRLTGCQFPSGRAEVGHYQVPFQFTVPTNASSTVVVPLIGRNSASVTHMIAVGICVGGKVHYVHSVPFQVKAMAPQAINPTMIEDRKEINFCCCFGKGEMVLGAHLDKNAYASGEGASLTYEVNNASSSKVEKLQVDIIGTVTASAKGHSFHRTNVIASMLCDPVEANDGFGSRRPEGGPAKTLTLRVPSQIPYPTSSTKNLRIEYRVAVSCETACCVTNPSIALPVTIYQQTMDQSAMIQGYNMEIENPAEQEYPLLVASVVYAPDSNALHGTAPPAHMRAPVAIPVDTTGDGIANALGYDTTGDGKIDALDTNRDGKIDMRLPQSKSTPPMAQASYITGPQHNPQPIPVDTTGDGRPNAMGYDTTGDGKIDSLDTNKDGRIDMTLQQQQQPPPAYSQTDANRYGGSVVHPDPNGYGGGSYSNSYGGHYVNSVPPSSQNMNR